jgi:hypothetical protein
MTGYSNRHSCRNLFWQFGILPFKSQYIYSVLLFVLKNRIFFTTNHNAHNLQTRESNYLYLPTSTLTLYQKGVYFTGIKLFNNLPLEIKEIVQIPKQFKNSLRRYLITHCFYDLDEFYSLNKWCCKPMVPYELYGSILPWIYVPNCVLILLYLCIILIVFHIFDFTAFIILTCSNYLF